jgi:DNA-binding MarR family transcriptional regulator
MGTPSGPARAELRNGLLLAGRKLSAATIMFHQAVADRLGLNITDHKCLDLILLNGPMSAGALAESTGLTTGAITAVLDRLERAGFVRRAADPTDRRKVVAEALPKRLEEARKLFEPFVVSLDELTGRYDDRELAAILDYMTNSATVLQHSTGRLRQEALPKRKKKSPLRRARPRTN